MLLIATPAAALLQQLAYEEIINMMLAKIIRRTPVALAVSTALLVAYAWYGPGL
jgi:hypothetical protein